MSQRTTTADHQRRRWSPFALRLSGDNAHFCLHLPLAVPEFCNQACCIFQVSPTVGSERSEKKLTLLWKSPILHDWQVSWEIVALKQAFWDTVQSTVGWLSCRMLVDSRRVMCTFPCCNHYLENCNIKNQMADVSCLPLKTNGLPEKSRHFNINNLIGGKEEMN